MTTDVWIYRWTAQSRTTAGKQYVVALKRDGTFGCDCPAWKFHKAPKPDCKHILAIKRIEPSATREEVERNSGKTFDAPAKRLESLQPVLASQAVTTKPFVLQTRRVIEFDVEI